MSNLKLFDMENKQHPVVEKMEDLKIGETADIKSKSFKYRLRDKHKIFYPVYSRINKDNYLDVGKDCYDLKGDFLRHISNANALMSTHKQQNTAL